MNPIPTETDLAFLAARQGLYRFTAICLLDPRAGAWSDLYDQESHRLITAAAAIVREEPSAAPADLARGEFPLLCLNPVEVFSALPPRYDALNALYESTFGLLVSGGCPPYETEYINSKFESRRSQTLADVAGFYAAFGLELSRAVPERPDHLARELEFMANLIALERMAFEEGAVGADERLAVCRDAQRNFLSEHVCWWAPTFARLLTLQAPGTFYASVGKFLAALIAAERALLGVPSPTAPVQPTSIERPEECQGCLLQS